MQVALNFKKMSKKIVIDKEVLDKLKSNAKKLIENTIGQTQKINEARLSELETIEALATEIDTDQSIDERAKKYGYSANGDDGIRDFLAYKDGATEQDLISKAREMENADKKISNNIIKKVCCECGDEKIMYNANGKLYCLSCKPF